MMNKRAMMIWSLAVLAAAMLSGTAKGSDLKARLPQATVGFVQFTGADACAAAYETTPLARMTSDPDMARLIDSAWPAVAKLIVEEARKEGEAEAAQAGLAVAHTLWRKGFILDWIEVGMGPMGPAPALVFATEPGADGAAFVEQVNILLDEGDLPPAAEVTVAGKTMQARPLPAPGMTLRYGVVDGVFVAVVGEQAAEQVLAALAGEGSKLADSPALKAEMDQIGAAGRQNVVLAFADVAGLMDQLRTIAGAMMGGEGFPPPVQQVIEELGLAGVARATVSLQIADHGFRSTWRLATQGERKGFLKLAEQVTLSDADVQWIPRDASFGTAMNLDLPAAYDETMRVLGMLPMVPTPLVEARLAQFKEKTGLDLRADLLATLADGWAFFEAPSSGGFLFSNFALVVEVKDAEAANELLARGVEALVRLMRAEGTEVGGELLTTKRNGVEVRFLQFLGLPIPVAPAWTIHDQHVVLGLTPQLVRNVTARIKGADARSASILANPDFVELRKKLPDDLTAVSYVDTAAGVRQLYPLVALVATGASGMLRAQGVAVDADVVPDMATATKGMFGSVWGITVADDAVMQVGYGPTPVAVPEFGGGGLASTAMLTSIMLPSLSRARTLSKRTVSGSNLRQIGVACEIYAYDHQGQYPPDLQTLVAAGDITDKSLEAPAGPGGPSYAYIAGHTTSSPPHWVVAYEDYPGITKGANVLFADGHVEFIQPLSRVEERIAQTREEMAAKQQP